VPNHAYNDSIIVARSCRYNQPKIDYSFLSKYNKIYFVGVPDEYSAMKKSIPHIEFIAVNDFLELAQIIAGCKLFIGNQSFPFSLAEALKVNRLLEVNYDCPNVTVYGHNGFDFYFQPHFEKLVQQRYENL
jgi:ADP-heptose:LPS heptosyltransferase